MVGGIFKKPYTKKEQEIYNLAYNRGISIGKTKGRKESIDEFTNKMIIMMPGHKDDIKQIAEQLMQNCN